MGPALSLWLPDLAPGTPCRLWRHPAPWQHPLTRANCLHLSSCLTPACPLCRRHLAPPDLRAGTPWRGPLHPQLLAPRGPPRAPPIHPLPPSSHPHEGTRLEALAPGAGAGRGLGVQGDPQADNSPSPHSPTLGATATTLFSTIRTSILCPPATSGPETERGPQAQYRPGSRASAGASGTSGTCGLGSGAPHDACAQCGLRSCSPQGLIWEGVWGGAHP